MALSDSALRAQESLGSQQTDGAEPWLGPLSHHTHNNPRVSHPIVHMGKLRPETQSGLPTSRAARKWQR